MHGNKSLCLFGRLELRNVGPTHTPLSHPGRLVGLLCSIILVLLSTMYCLWDQLTMCYTVASQLISHDLSRLATVILH